MPYTYSAAKRGVFAAGRQPRQSTTGVFCLTSRLLPSRNPFRQNCELSWRARCSPVFFPVSSAATLAPCHRGSVLTSLPLIASHSTIRPLAEIVANCAPSGENRAVVCFSRMWRHLPCGKDQTRTFLTLGRRGTPAQGRTREPVQSIGPSPYLFLALSP